MRIKNLEEQGCDWSDFNAAMAKGFQWGDEPPVGVFYKSADILCLQGLDSVLADGGPLAFRKLGVSANRPPLSWKSCSTKNYGKRSEGSVAVRLVR